MASKRKSKGATKKRSALTLRPILKPLGLVSIAILIVSALVVSSSQLRGVRWVPMPLENIELDAELVYQSSEGFEAALLPFKGKSLLMIDVSEVRKTVQALPWIRNASVGKKWPNTLEVTVTEFQPVALWNEEKVLNSEGLALEQPSVKMDLAQLNGPEQSALEVMEHYLQFSRVIDSVDAQVKKVTLHSRGAWEIEITHAIKIALGDRNVLERSRRVVDVIRAHDGIEKIKSIDARYPNGVAIGYHENEEIEVQQ